MSRGTTLFFLTFFLHQVAFADSKVFAQSGVAIGGYDAVAYHTEKQAVKGGSHYSHKWNGSTWQFSSRSNRDKFVRSPAKYAPQYGGYCAYAVAKGSLAATDPHAWTIHKGKLYLNYSESISNSWKKDIDGYIAAGNNNWPELDK